MSDDNDKTELPISRDVSNWQSAAIDLRVWETARAERALLRPSRASFRSVLALAGRKPFRESMSRGLKFFNTLNVVTVIANRRYDYRFSLSYLENIINTVAYRA